jgi:hypothetical protein
MNFKNIYNENELINFFENLTSQKPGFFCQDNTENLLYKENYEFILEIRDEIKTTNEELRFLTLEKINKNVISIGNLKLKVLEFYIKNFNLYNSKFRIKKFSSLNFDENKKYFYRCIIPSDLTKNFNYNDFFSRFKFITNINNRTMGGIEFEIDNNRFQMYDWENYFIIECLDKIDFKSFNKYVRSCLSTFGFFTGIAPMDNGYFFAYEKYNQDFCQFLYSNDFIKTYKSDSIISLNPYKYYQNKNLNFSLKENGEFKVDEKIKEIENKLKPIEREHFEKLITFLNNDEKISEMIYTYLNISNKNNNLAINIKCASYAILLEMITNFIVDKNKEKFILIKDKKIRSELQTQLNKTAKKIFKKYKIEDFENSPIKKRIEQICSPTNRDKLLKPFELLNINLTEEEKNIIYSRNKFLHGGNPFRGNDIYEQSQYLFYYSLKFNYFIVALLLKYIGYSGIVKNLAKIYLDYLDLPELKEEEYYKEL